MMKKIEDSEVRWGILGVGNVCEVKSAPAMQIVPHSKLVAVMRRSEERVRDYAQRHGVPKWYTNAQALVDDSGSQCRLHRDAPAHAPSLDQNGRCGR
jgi:predicted dehydrogenase